MSALLVEASDAPVDQGVAQGRALGAALAREVGRQRAALGWFAARALARRVRATSARALATQLPWQRERLEGIAQGARVPLYRLELAEALARVSGTAFADGPRLALVFELPRELAPLLVLRRSRPDAGGFPSVELTLGFASGCLAGVNAEGIAVAAVRDLGRDEPSLRHHAQELLFRARDLGAGIDYLRRRASYAGGSGTLVAADARGEVRVLRLERGALQVDECAALAKHAPDARLELDAALQRLRWREASGEWRELVAQAESAAPTPR